MGSRSHEQSRSNRSSRHGRVRRLCWALAAATAYKYALEDSPSPLEVPPFVHSRGELPGFLKTNQNHWQCLNLSDWQRRGISKLIEVVEMN